MKHGEILSLGSVLLTFKTTVYRNESKVAMCKVKLASKDRQSQGLFEHVLLHKVFIIKIKVAQH